MWHIGIFDRSSAEFADAAPTQPVNFDVGKDDPQKAWYGYAPAIYPSSAPSAALAPRAIRFSLDGKPSTAYRLRVSLLIEHSSVPALRVSINGHSGLFYLHPRLDYSMGDTMAAFYPAYSHATVEFDFPGSDLRSGANSISLQAVGTADKGV